MACGSGPIGNSGVATKTDIVDLTSDEAADLCEYIFSLLEQPARDVDCGAGRIVTVGINAEDVVEGIANCADDLQAVDASCSATVGEFETCFEDSASASDEVICSPDLIPNCSNVAPCI